MRRSSGQFRLVFFSHWLACGLLLSVVGTGCVSRNQVLFQNKEHEAYYRQLRKTNAAVIRLRPDSVAQPYSYLVRPDDQLQIGFVNFPPEYAYLLPTTNNQQQQIAFQRQLLNGGSGLQQQRLQQQQQQQTLTAVLIVDPEGNITLPQLGRVQVAGKTPLQVRKQLEETYRQYVPEAYLTIAIPSLRAYVFSNISDVVFLPDERTHLVDFLALSNSLDRRVRANQIKIIRGDYRNPQVIWVDLTKSDALQYPDLYIQPEDIVYIRPRDIVFVQETAAYVSMLSVFNTLLSFYVIFRSDL